MYDHVHIAAAMKSTNFFAALSLKKRNNKHIAIAQTLSINSGPGSVKQTSVEKRPKAPKW